MVEAKGFEEMIRRDKESRKPKPVYQEAVVVAGQSGHGMSRDLSSLVEKATETFSPPDRAGFDQLYSEANFTNMISSRVDNNMLTVMTPSYNISLNVRTVLEIIAQQMRTPLNLPSELNLKSPPPFVLNIKEISNYWISEMLCEYQKIFRLNDPLIQKMCHEYFLSLSYPIMVRLAYTEWENRQMDWKVGLKVKEIAVDYAKKNRDLKIDYDKQLDVKTTIMKTQLNRAQMENKELWTKITVQDERIMNLKQDEQNRVGEVEDTHLKFKAEQSRVQQLEKEILVLKADIKKLEGQVKEDEDTAGWKPDVTSTPEIPVYRNKSLGKALIFPVPMEQFKKEYKLKGQEGSICIYEKEDGTRFELPDTLSDELVSGEYKPKKNNKTNNEEASIKLKANKKWQEIVASIVGFGEEGATGKEIANDVNVNSTNIRRDYLNEMEEEGIIKGAKVGKEKRYTMSS